MLLERLFIFLDQLERRPDCPPEERPYLEILVRVHLDIIDLGALAENIPGWRCGPLPVGRTSVK